MLDLAAFHLKVRVVVTESIKQDVGARIQME